MISMPTAYFSLIELVEEYGIIIWDTAIEGPGGTLKLRKSGNKCLILIDGSLSYKKRILVLLHEIGHIFYYRHQELKLRKRAAGETEANRTAVKLLRSFERLHGIDLVPEFVRFYNESNRGKKRSKFVLD